MQPSSRRTAALSGVLLGVMMFATACSGGSPAVDQSVAQTSGQASGAAEEIPVEALPDPLPAPFLFRDEVTIERPIETETIYVVQPGDTLALIAMQFCLTTEELQRLNNIPDVNDLDVGQELRIPIREGGCGEAAPPQIADDQSGDETTGTQQPPGEIYVVQAGDTLADIADLFGFAWRDLMNYNGLTETQAANLQVGQTLIIPPPSEQSEEQSTEQSDDGASEPPG